MQALTTRTRIAAVLLAVPAILIPSQAAAQQAAPITSDLLETFRPREIGPAVTGGRVHDIEVLPSDPSTIYAASASGGLWKSTNRGQTWRNISDGQFELSTFGDLAISASDPQILYAGTGEQNNRQSTSWGDGVYRSDDAGETWRHLGLVETRHIGKIEIDPRNPDVVFVAALGNLWRGSEERGVYRSTDGGRSWEKVFYVDEYTGVVDLVMNPRNPDIVYAAAYARLRRTWGFNGGGPGGGVFKTTDGGDTWRELTNGIPDGDKGRIGLAISASNPMVLYAMIEHEDGKAQGTYRSEDGGESWERVNSLNPRPMYYSEVFIDPNDEDVVYVLGTSSSKSTDGGRSFTEIAKRPTYDVGVHADHHALWIDPNDGEHLYLAGDAGIYETYDGGVNFRKVNNFVTGQFYAVGVDMRDPYRVYGGMQDNHSWMGPSETRRWIGIINDDWKQTGFGDGMYQQVDPTNPRYVYANSNGGSYYRLDALTGDMRDIRPQPAPGEERYRWDWVTPSLISPHDPTTVYLGGNRLFISNDRGDSFRRTEDLTRRIDRDELELMGIRGADIRISRNDGTSSFGEITVIAESPLAQGVLWVGTDDGNLQLSRDGGDTWTEFSGNVQGITDGTYVSRIVPSRTGVGTAYVTFDAHRDGDFAPYVFRTTDFGQSWEPLTNGLPSGSVNALVEHPANPNVLFLGTEHGLFVSTNAGADWVRVPNTPTTAYDDLVIHPREKDLVMGTHGRGIWILDDTRPIAEWNQTVADADAHLFTTSQGTIFNYWKDTSYRGQEAYAGENPPSGTQITYKLGAGSGDARMRITNEDGRVVWDQAVPSSEGIHRVNWDLRHEPRGGSDTWTRHDDPRLARPVTAMGPFVSPGAFTVTLEARGATVSQPLSVRGDPQMPLSQADYEQRERFMLELMDLQDRVEQAKPGLRCGGGRGMGGGFGRGGGPQLQGVDADLCAVSRGAQQIFRSLNGGGVRPGTLYPPTLDQIARKDRLETLLATSTRAMR
jgi:photosystem II stability/assembly factor-like uncharacterized protein